MRKKGAYVYTCKHSVIFNSTKIVVQDGAIIVPTASTVTS